MKNHGIRVLIGNEDSNMTMVRAACPERPRPVRLAAKFEAAIGSGWPAALRRFLDTEPVRLGEGLLIQIQGVGRKG